MNKIILVFITLFIISCANSTTNTNINIGSGTVIDEIIVDEPKITFSEDKKIAVYYDPHSLKTINLIKKEY